MKIFHIAAALAWAALGTSCAHVTPVLKPGNIDRVIAAMTTEEKAHLLVGGGQTEVLDSTAVEMIAASEKMVPGCAGFTIPITRLGIPAIVMADGPAGLRIQPTRPAVDSAKTYYCTGMPIGTLLASSWDTELVRDVTRAIGNEVLEYGVDVLLAPGQNIHRNPLCGRNYEYFSEDPVLSGLISAAYVNGVQDNGVGTSVKHFAFNNQELNRCGNDSRLDVRTAWEIYLKNFELTLRGSRPWTVMSSYNYVNGEYTSQRRDLLTDILRGDMGFDGLVVSDWGGGHDAAAQIAAGNDLIEAGNAARYNRIMEAIGDGTLSMDAVDEAVRNVLNLVVKCPKFKGYKPSDNPDLVAHAAVARKAAGEGMVLLKNDGALPLVKGSSVALFGSNSYKLIAGGTGAGDVNKAYVVNLDRGLSEAGFMLDPTLDEAYCAHVESEKARLEPINRRRGWWFGELPLGEMPSCELPELASAAAETSSAALVTLVRQAGEGSDRQVDDDFNLRQDEIELISMVAGAFHAAGKKVSVILNVGGVVETASWRDMVDAILVAWQPGQEAGYAIADVLGGDVNPSGRLPMTFPMSYGDVPSQNFPHVVLPEGKNGSFYHCRGGHLFHDIENVDWTDYDEGIYVGYRHYATAGVPVSYPFGFGLSYTDFEFSKLSAKPVKDGWKVSVDVRNVGDREGREVVQFYSGNDFEKDCPVRELRAFAKTPMLQPGESATVSVMIEASDLAHFNADDFSWVTQAGTYTLYAAHNVDDTALSTSVEVRRPIVRAVSHSLGNL